MEREQTMSDNAKIVRGYIAEWAGSLGLHGEMIALAALDALVAERDKANADWHRMRDLHADALTEIERLREGFEFSCQCGKSYVFSPPSDPRNQDDNPHPDAEDDA